MSVAYTVPATANDAMLFCFSKQWAGGTTVTTIVATYGTDTFNAMPEASDWMWAFNNDKQYSLRWLPNPPLGVSQNVTVKWYFTSSGRKLYNTMMTWHGEGIDQFVPFANVKVEYKGVYGGTRYTETTDNAVPPDTNHGKFVIFSHDTEAIEGHGSFTIDTVASGTNTGPYAPTTNMAKNLRSPWNLGISGLALDQTKPIPTDGYAIPPAGNWSWRWTIRSSTATGGPGLNSIYTFHITPKTSVAQAVAGVLSGSATAQAVFLRLLVGAMSMAGALSRRVFYDIEAFGNMVLSGDLLKRFFRVFESSINFSSTLGRVRTSLAQVFGNLSLWSSLNRRFFKTFLGNLPLSVDLDLKLSLTRFVSGTISFAKNIKNRFFKIFEGLISLSGFNDRKLDFDREFSGLLSFDGGFFNLVTTVKRLIADILMRSGVAGDEVSAQIEMFVTSTDNPVDIEVRR